VYTEPDALSLHVLEAEEKVCLGSSTREYTNAAKLLEAALAKGCRPCWPCQSCGDLLHAPDCFAMVTPHDKS
jgi:biotin carboxylase